MRSVLNLAVTKPLYAGLRIGAPIKTAPRQFSLKEFAIVADNSQFIARQE